MTAPTRPRRPPRRDWTPTPPSGWRDYEAGKGPRSHVPAKERERASRERQRASSEGRRVSE